MKILDIDLDFFLDRKKSFGNVTDIERLDSNEYMPWTSEQTKIFLENQFGLDPKKKIPGKIFTHHDEVFLFLRELQQSHDFSLQFSIDHLDAHCDIGMGDTSYNYISSEILSLPVEERHNIQKIGGMEGLGPGNYLSFAIACRWISDLTYINNKKWSNDLLRFHFKDFDPATNIIELKRYTSQQIQQMIDYGDFYKKALTIIPLAIEPEVPFRFIDYNDIAFEGNYDFIFLTQSLGFTPLESDLLIPVIQQYISLI